MMDSNEKTTVNEAEVEVTPAEAVETVAQEAPVTETTEEQPVAEAPEEAPAAEQEVPAAEEAPAAAAEEVPATAEETPAAEQAEPQIPLMKTKEEVLARAEEIAEQGTGGDKQELDLLKQLYYKYHRADLMAAQQAFVEAGGEAEAFQPEIDPTEEAFKQAMQRIRQRRADIQAEQERQRAENLQKKQAVIEKIKQLATTPEEAGKSYDTFKELQNEWREIGPVPAENVSEVWKNYQLYVEQFYDMLKLNIQFREYDFRKNLEAKTLLCEQAEKLAEETDVVVAINKLQTLHQEWKEIGPVAKELREEIWNRFKEASTVIRKRHQEFFEARKAKEEENLQKKTELCEQVEAISTEGLKSFSDWDAKTKEIIDLQAVWKTVGFAPQKVNTQIFERFRTACDKFFTEKAAYFKAVKEELNQNLQKKRALVEKAESLQESTEWRETSDALIALQKEWKTIGAVPRKVSEELWKRFTSACDHFFEAKNAATAEERGEQKENLQKKQDIIDRLKALAEDAAEATAQKVRDLQAEWNAVGHVPIRDKERMYRQYHDVVDTLYKKLNLGRAEQRLNSFKTTLKVTAESGAGTLARERERLSRAYEIMKGELQTYENNIGFLTASSKKGNSLVAEIQKKVDKLKDELNLLREKIKAVEQEMHKQAQQ
ncbi:MAG: DUF349 domain-containing protein [Bacteroidaceae bacterium]|nr:DUF349 domain-containing protein [Bacteroidaceae bacterium]